jgi:hypothetical protein
MKYIFSILLATALVGCTKTYTNEECVKEVCNKINCDSYDRLDRAFAEIGASFECAKNNNDPDKTLKNPPK